MINYLDYNQYAGSLKALATIAKNNLDKEGYIVVQNFDKDCSSMQEKKQKFLTFSEYIGLPISHDIKGTIIWDIKNNESSKSFIKTFSEHNHEADLHTDSQYSSYPEDYFGLLTLKRAACGGGISYLLSLQNILKELKSTAEGLAMMEILMQDKFPFVVPNVFKKHSSKKVEYVLGTILSSTEIRYRTDTIQKALDYHPSICTPRQVAAFHYLRDLVRHSAYTHKFFLEKGDLFLINNKTTLHGRGSFEDNERHLLRIRMNKTSASVATSKSQAVPKSMGVH